MNAASKTAGGEGVFPDALMASVLKSDLRRWCYPNQDDLMTAAIGAAAACKGEWRRQ